jgi:Xaa-Pro dipeptidase
MPLHFDDAEYAARLDQATKAINDAGLDGLLMFAPESQYWICGYDTFGFALFQCLVLGADGQLDLVTRTPDLRQAQLTSTLSDDHIHIWKDVEGMRPAQDLKALLARRGLLGKRLGYEGDTAGLTDFNGQMLRDVLDQPLVEASGIIRQCRRLKSSAEIAMHRRAAALSDDALDAGITATHAGAFEGDILAAMQGAVFKGGGDYAGNEFIMGSGDYALLCRYYSGRRHLDAQDQLTVEWSGAYARYHAAMMRTMIVGTPSPHQLKMQDVAAEAMLACEAEIKPGAPMANVFAAYAKTFDAAGLQDARLKACGYGMGAIYNPIWVDFPMFYEGNQLLMQAGQVFFLHMIAMDDAAGAAMCLGHSVLVTDTGVERLSRYPLDLIIR